MNIVAGRMNHKTNTFSPVPTPLTSFGPDGPTFGAQALAQARGTRTGLGAFITAVEARGERITVAVNATASPSGRVDDAAFERMADSLVDAARAGCDLLLLDLHGAMATQSFDDAEGELLRRLRAVTPHTPMAVALDLHGNITQTMIDCADVIVGFQTYPHIDMFETGAHAAHLAFQMIASGRPPALAWVQLPLLSHTLRAPPAKAPCSVPCSARANSKAKVCMPHPSSPASRWPTSRMPGSAWWCPARTCMKPKPPPTRWHTKSGPTVPALSTAARP